VIGFISYPLKFDFKILVKFYDLRKRLNLRADLHAADVF